MRMIKVMFGLVFCISFCYANPVLVTYINEFQTASDFGQAIELHPSHSVGSHDIGGWTIRTRAGIATIFSGTTIPNNGYIVIDTYSVTGIFHMNETSDSLSLYDNYGLLRGRVVWGYPGSKTPAPPYNMSTCVHRSNPSMYWDLFSYYIDSTPTLGDSNNNWSSISGIVFNAQGQPVSGHCVIADGNYGSSCIITNSTGNFNICGLAQGKYWITVWSSWNVQAGNYPESIYVGYSQNIPNINIYLPISGIEHNNYSAFDDNLISVPNPIRKDSKISFVLPYENKVMIKIYDTKGNLLKTLLNQKLNAGRHQFALNVKLVPGVYFLNVDIGKQRLTKKLISVN